MTEKLLLLATLLASTSAQAYVGPGLGAGTLGVIAGFALSVFLALFAIIWYPFKRLLKSFARTTAKDNKQDVPAGSVSTEQSDSGGS